MSSFSSLCFREALCTPGANSAKVMLWQWKYYWMLICIWWIYHTQLLTGWAANRDTNISSPLPPCRSMCRWSSCRVCRWWPDKGHRWTWPSWRSSSGCLCRNPYSSALCISLTPSSDCCEDKQIDEADDYLINCSLLFELTFLIVVVIWCFWCCQSHTDEVWTDFTSGSVLLPWEINIIQEQNLGSCQVFFSLSCPLWSALQ